MSNQGVYVPEVFVPNQQKQTNNQQQPPQQPQAATQPGTSSPYVPSVFKPPGQQQQQQQARAPSYHEIPASSGYVPSAAAMGNATSYTPQQPQQQPPTQTRVGSTPTPASEPTAAPTSTEPTSRPVPTPASNAAGKVKDEDMRAEFNMIDVDNNGFIEAKDFKQVFGSFAPTSMVNKALSYLDKNGDKKISFEEYKAARAPLGPIKIPGITK